MKRTFLIGLCSAFLCAAIADDTVYPELLSNAGFEQSSVSSFLGVTQFDDWSLPMGCAIADTDDKLEGNQSLHINQANLASNVLYQEVYTTDYEAGNLFEARIRYKVISNPNNGELTTDCYWNLYPDGRSDHEADKLVTTLELTDEWQTVTIQTSKPSEAARQFHFRVLVPKKMEVLFDDFSFRRIEGQGKTDDDDQKKDDDDPKDEDNTWATSFNWSSDVEPLKLLIEPFDNVVHNKPLHLDGWQNVVLSGERPWWGFDEAKSPQDDGNERCAKATSYVYNATDSEQWEMWLVTPALDFVNAESKIFTLRVMAQYVPEAGNPAALQVYYIDATRGADDVYWQDLQIELPATHDEADEWQEYHIDFTGLEIADVFYIGFRFTGPSGADNPVVYYLDDISWGRTDIPTITTNLPYIEANATLNEATALAEVEVITRNLTENITVSIESANASSFGLSTNVLPKEGGTVAIAFLGDQIGLYEAYLKLTSRGAVTKYVPIYVHVNDATALEETTIDPDAENNPTSNNPTLNTPCYNILGQPIPPTYHGIIIHNGKKHLQR